MISIRLILLGFFAFHFFALSGFAATAEKKITRWTGDVMDLKNNFARGEFSIAIYDAEKNPVLIELYYQIGGVIYSFDQLYNFKILSKGRFRIRLRQDNDVLNDPANRALSIYMPTFLGIELGNSTLTLESLDENNISVVRGIPTTKNYSTPSDFKRIRDSKLYEDFYKVRIPSTADNLTYDQYFSKLGVEFPFVKATPVAVPAAVPVSLAKSEPAESNKRITRWTADFTHPDNNKKMQITISILDADTQHPALIEFLYSIGEGTEARTIRTTEVSALNIYSFYDGKPETFTIRLEANLQTKDGSFNHFSDFAPLIPQFFSLNRRLATLELTKLEASMQSSLATLPVQKTRIAIDEFTPVSPLSTSYVFSAGNPGAYASSSYFSVERIGYGKINNPAETAQAKPAQVEKPVEVKKEKMITRWTAPLLDVNTNYELGKIFISVLDADTDPTLIEFYYDIEGRGYYIHYAEKFELIADSPGTFRLVFKHYSGYYDGKKIRSAFKTLQPYIPKSLSFNKKGLDMVLEPIPDEIGRTSKNVRALPSGISLIPALDFKTLGNKESYKALRLNEDPEKAVGLSDYFNNDFSLKGTAPIAPVANDKRITRWTVTVPDPETGADRGFLNLSILDAETDPVVIEFSYKFDLAVFTVNQIKKFELVSDDPGKFKIYLEHYEVYFNDGKARREMVPYIPKSLTFSAKDKTPEVLFETISDKTSVVQNIRKLPANRALLSTQDFKEKDRLYSDYIYKVFKPSERSPISYDQHFKSGIPFPNFNSASAKPQNKAKPADDKRITRWLVNAIDPRTNSLKRIFISVFDAETNPVLIEFSYNVAGINERTFSDIIKFELVPNKLGHFRIQMEERRGYYDGNHVSREYKNAVFDVPKTISFNTKDDTVTLETISDKESADSSTKNIIDFGATRAVLSADHFHKLSNDSAAYKVLEPSTIHALSYDQYFSAKGIHFPHINSSSSLSSTSSQSSYSLPVNSADDLELGPLLKDKKAEVWQLLQSKDKPTIAEFLNVIGIKPKKDDTNPFKEYLRNKNLRFDLENILPTVLAQFEKAFPGAIWYGLGRDIYLFADAMDAYYVFKGQTDRVKRLHASQPSFEENNPEVVIDFLKSNGFDFAGINKDSTPRIIFDVTSYSKNQAGDRKQNRFSQSAQLMRAAYLEWQRLGRKPYDLLSKVNFVSVSDGPNNIMIEPDTNIEKFFNKMSFDPPAPQRILQVWGPHSLQYATSWHSIYERFQRTKDNKVIAPFGRSASNGDKLAMLAELWDVAAMVMNDNFVKTTDKQINKFKKAKQTACDETLTDTIPHR